MSRGRNKRRQTSGPPQPADQKALPKSTLPSEIDKAPRPQIQERQVVQSQYFAGPLPPPDHLSGYERVTPGAAERIFRMAESQAEHRRAMESKVVDSNVRLESRGQIFGFVIGMTALIGGIVLMAFDKSITGVATSLSALAALVGLFVWSKRKKKSELSEKANSIALGADPAAPPKLPGGPGRN